MKQLSAICSKAIIPAIAASVLLGPGAAQAADAITAAGLAEYLPEISDDHGYVDSGKSFPLDNGLGVIEQPGQPSTLLGTHAVTVTRTAWPSIQLPVFEDQPPLPPGLGELPSTPIIGLPANIAHHMEAGWITRDGWVPYVPYVPRRPGAYQITASYSDPGMIQETVSGVVRPLIDPITESVNGVIDGIRTTLDEFTGGLCRLKYNLPTKVSGLKGRELGFECLGLGAGYGLVVAFGGLPGKSLTFTFSSFQDKKYMYDLARDTRMWSACRDILDDYDVCRKTSAN